MYLIYADNRLKIYDPREDEGYKVSNPVIEVSDNSSGTLKFSVDKKHEYYNEIKTSRYFYVFIEKNGVEEPFGEYRPFVVDKDFYNTLHFDCEGSLSYLNDTIQYPNEFHDTSPRSFLDEIIRNHNNQVEENNKKFTLGMVTLDNNLYRYTNYEQTMEVINQKLVKRIGGHIRVRFDSNGDKVIDYLKESDNTNTQPIEFGSNLLDYSENFDISSIATRIVPLGARIEGENDIKALEKYTDISSVNNGNHYVESESAISEHGVITRVVKWDDVKEPSNLKRKAIEYLKNIQFESMTLNLKAIDLNMLDKDVERIKVGDKVRVISKPHGMDRYFYVSKIQIDVVNPSNNTFELGSKIPVGISEKTVSENMEIKEKIENMPKKNEILEQAKANATALLTALTTGHVVTRPNEILIMDTDNIETATKVWRWNMNGLGYSNTGVSGPYGTAITQDGHIVADYITTGTLDGDLIRSGTIKDQNGNLTWNLNDGSVEAKRFSIDSPNFKLDKWGNIEASNATLDGTLTSSSSNGSTVSIKSGQFLIKKNNKDLGHMGSNTLVNSNIQGLTFDLEKTGDFMSWAIEEKEDAGYNWKFVYTKNAINKCSADTLTAFCNLDLKHHTLENAVIKNPYLEIKGHSTASFTQGPIYLPTQPPTDTDHCKVYLRNGILCYD